MKITQSKSQASIEFVLIIGILFLIFIAILAFSIGIQQNTNKVRGDFKKTKECFRISRLISAVYTGGDGTEIITKTDYQITVFNTSFISVKDLSGIETETEVLCTFSAKASYSEVAGDFRIINEDSTIKIENITSS